MRAADDVTTKKKKKPKQNHGGVHLGQLARLIERVRSNLSSSSSSSTIVVFPRSSHSRMLVHSLCARLHVKAETQRSKPFAMVAKCGYGPGAPPRFDCLDCCVSFLLCSFVLKQNCSGVPKVDAVATLSSRVSAAHGSSSVFQWSSLCLGMRRSPSTLQTKRRSRTLCCWETRLLQTCGADFRYHVSCKYVSISSSTRSRFFAETIFYFVQIQFFFRLSFWCANRGAESTVRCSGTNCFGR